MDQNREYSSVVVSKVKTVFKLSKPEGAAFCS